ncbi:MAG: carboxylating nicotinate-nucleotide diphosphorylase [Rickettsiales bacterium]|nr:carboxylating nicotinate-nucleotide diphosphorylase [Rickettsiales bacterium]
MKNLVEKALIEDIGSGDITSLATITEDKQASFKLIAKESFILCGVEIFQQVFETIDPKVKITTYYKDGDEILDRDIILSGEGNARSILKSERVALNFMQYLSSLATRTRSYAELCRDTNIKILDTRKTVPLYRELAKYAVRVGGGHNHRMGLYDAILIKDNHIAAIGGVKDAITAIRLRYPNKFIEIECEDLNQVREAVRCNVETVMLDNMDNDLIAQAIGIIGGSCKIEVSGNINKYRVEKIRKLKIDYISIGDITYNTSFCDISLKISVKI